MAPSEIMRRIKGHTSSKLFEEFPHLKKKYWGRHFGREGTFVPVGQMTEAMIEQYLEAIILSLSRTTILKWNQIRTVV